MVISTQTNLKITAGVVKWRHRKIKLLKLKLRRRKRKHVKRTCPHWTFLRFFSSMATIQRLPFWLLPKTIIKTSRKSFLEMKEKGKTKRYHCWRKSVLNCCNSTEVKKVTSFKLTSSSTFSFEISKKRKYFCGRCFETFSLYSSDQIVFRPTSLISIWWQPFFQSRHFVLLKVFKIYLKRKWFSGEDYFEESCRLWSRAPRSFH